MNKLGTLATGVLLVLGAEKGLAQTDTTINEGPSADTVEVVDQSDVAQATKQVAASINIYCSGNQKRKKGNFLRGWRTPKNESNTIGPNNTGNPIQVNGKRNCVNYNYRSVKTTEVVEQKNDQPVENEGE